MKHKIPEDIQESKENEKPGDSKSVGERERFHLEDVVILLAFIGLVAVGWKTYGKDVLRFLPDFEFDGGDFFNISLEFVRTGFKWLFVAFLAACVIFEFFFKRIPRSIMVLAVTAGLLGNLILNGGHAFVNAFLGILLMTVFFLIPFLASRISFTWIQLAVVVTAFQRTWFAVWSAFATIMCVNFIYLIQEIRRVGISDTVARLRRALRGPGHVSGSGDDDQEPALDDEDQVSENIFDSNQKIYVSLMWAIGVALVWFLM
jgi:hypothetical protein